MTLTLQTYPTNNRLNLRRGTTDGTTTGVSESVIGIGQVAVITLNNPGGAQIVMQRRRVVGNNAFASVGVVTSRGSESFRMQLLGGFEYRFSVLGAGTVAADITTRLYDEDRHGSIAVSEGFPDTTTGTGSGTPATIDPTQVLTRYSAADAASGKYPVGVLVVGADGALYQLNADKGGGVPGNALADPTSGDGSTSADWVRRSGGTTTTNTFEQRSTTTAPAVVGQLPTGMPTVINGSTHTIRFSNQQVYYEAESGAWVEKFRFDLPTDAAAASKTHFVTATTPAVGVTFDYMEDPTEAKMLDWVTAYNVANAADPIKDNDLIYYTTPRGQNIPYRIGAYNNGDLVVINLDPTRLPIYESTAQPAPGSLQAPFTFGVQNTTTGNITYFDVKSPDNRFVKRSDSQYEFVTDDLQTAEGGGKYKVYLASGAYSGPGVPTDPGTPVPSLRLQVEPVTDDSRFIEIAIDQLGISTNKLLLDGAIVDPDTGTTGVLYLDKDDKYIRLIPNLARTAWDVHRTSGVDDAPDVEIPVEAGDEAQALDAIVNRPYVVKFYRTDLDGMPGFNRTTEGAITFWKEDATTSNTDETLIAFRSVPTVADALDMLVSDPHITHFAIANEGNKIYERTLVLGQTTVAPYTPDAIQENSPYVTPEQFGADGTVANDTAALLQCQASPLVKRLDGDYKCNQNIKLVDNAQWVGNGRIEFQGAYIGNEVDEDCRNWKIGQLTFTRTGTAGPCIQLRWGCRRFHMECDITGSTGMGADLQGVYIGRWKGNIRGCANHGLSMTEGMGTFNGSRQATSTGANDFGFDGEIQGCGFTDSVAAVYLEHCESVYLEKCTPEGNYIGIELGTQNRSISLPRYWEGSNTVGQIYTSDDAVQPCNTSVIPSGTSIYNKERNAGLPVDSNSAVKIRDAEHFLISKSVFFQGMETLVEPMIMIAERVSNRAHGGISEIWHDAPYGYVLQLNTRRFGFPNTRSYQLNKTLAADTDDSFTIYTSTSEFASKSADVKFAINALTEGVVKLKLVAFDLNGEVIYQGVFSNHEFHVDAGINTVELNMTIKGAEAIYGTPLNNPMQYIEVTRDADNVEDTAGDIEIISADVTVYDNPLRNKGYARLTDLVSGDRRLFMNVMVSPTLGSASGSRPNNMINGSDVVNAAGGWIPGSTNVAGEWVDLNIKGDGGAVLKGIDTATNIALGGRWELAASIDKITWNVLHPDIEWTTNRSWIVNGNTNAYKHYRLRGVSGTIDQAVRVTDLMPRIA